MWAKKDERGKTLGKLVRSRKDIYRIWIHKQLHDSRMMTKD
jgi:hypothetical protein